MKIQLHCEQSNYLELSIPNSKLTIQQNRIQGGRGGDEFPKETDIFKGRGKVKRFVEQTKTYTFGITRISREDIKNRQCRYFV